MATIVIDDVDAHENGNPVTPPGKADVVDEGTPQQSTAPETPPAEDEVPEKFRGKKLKEILDAYDNMEKLVGRQGAELGELRKTHDEVIRSFVATQKPSNPAAGSTKQDSTTDDDTEFFVNPKAAIEKAVMQHPEIQKLRQAERRLAAERALGQLAQQHSDWREVMSTPEFNQFVRANPIHMQLMQQADQAYDVAAAAYVISQFKSTRANESPASAPAAKPTADATEAARKAAVSASKVPAGAAAPSSDGGKPIYRRADLVRKMQRDPEWYAANADEILLAYQEGRVR